MAEKHGEYEQGPGVEEMIALLKGIEQVSGATTSKTEEGFLAVYPDGLILDDHAWDSISHLIAGARNFAEVVAQAQRDRDLGLLFGATVNFADYIDGSREVLEVAIRIAAIRRYKEQQRTDVDNNDSEEEN